MGDTQRTLIVEQLILGREQNDLERSELIGSMASDSPAFLVHLGDMVAWGASAEHWAYFDQLIKPLKDRHVEIDPVVGNHEYFGLSRAREMENLRARFPVLRDRHWYRKRYAELELIFLDSNEKKMSEADWHAQAEWFTAELARADADPAVRGTLVFAHHPALSNSKLSGDEDSVRRSFLPALVRSKKTLAYISGHAHGYEHFLENGKHFIVSGGGGGPRVRYLTGASERHQDLFKGPAPRPFHYLLLQPSPTGVQVIVKGFEKGEVPRVIDGFSMGYPTN